MTTLKVNKLKGSIKIVGDKSISHRALILSAMSIGKSEIFNILESEDVTATANVLKKLGIKIRKLSDKWVIYGNGTNGFFQPNQALDCGNSGTTARLMLGAVSTNPIYCTFIGDESLTKRPMSRVTDYLKKIGCDVSLTNNKHFPLTIKGSQINLPLTHKITKPSAQIKSAIILAALNIDGETSIIEPKTTRDHTELLLKYLNVKYRKQKIPSGGQKIIFNGPYEIRAKNINVAGDPSSSAFWVVGALITPNSKIKLLNVSLNKTRIAYIQILKKMGGKIKIKKLKKISGEIVGSIQVEYSKLKGINIPAKLSPYLIDEYPILSIAAAVAKGKTKMQGLTELKYKESNRIKSINENLKKCGIDSQVNKDNITINGSQKILSSNKKIKTYGDHRIAMSFSILSLITKNPLQIDNEECIKISYPNFKKDLNKLIHK